MTAISELGDLRYCAVIWAIVRRRLTLRDRQRLR